jgi:hypothetical protein
MMWRVTTLIRKRAGVPQRQFEHEWIDVVAPAIGERVARDGRATRVIVNIAPDDLDEAVSDVFPPAYDGLIEFWFDTPEDAVAAMAGLGADEDLRSLAEPIVDGAGGVAWLSKVVPSKPEQGTRVKFLAAGEVAHGVSLEDAHRYWGEQHPRVAQTAPQVWGPLTRYTQFHGVPQPSLEMGDWLAAPRFVPMCSDMGFAQAQDFLRVYTSEEYARVVRPDEEKFSRPGEMLSFVSGEERLLADVRA